MGKPREDLTGRKFGRLFVVQYDSPGKWLVRCDCGAEKPVRGALLRNGHTKSCGCLHRDIVTTHGFSKNPAYRCWKAMMSRCYKVSNCAYSRYGGAGVTVCERWRNSFTNFLQDMGNRPSSRHTLDRYPNASGNYEPGNVRWATWEEQNRNRSIARLLTLDGTTLTVAGWADRTGIGQDAILHRLAGGWSVSRALLEPIHENKRNRHASKRMDH